MVRARHRLESALHCYKESARTEESVLVRKDSITWHRLSPLRASVRLRDPSEANLSLSPNLGGLSGFSAPALRTLV